jgi:hypothetical protein
MHGAVSSEWDEQCSCLEYKSGLGSSVEQLFTVHRAAFKAIFCHNGHAFLSVL